MSSARKKFVRAISYLRHMLGKKKSGLMCFYTPFRLFQASNDHNNLIYIARASPFEGCLTHTRFDAWVAE